MAKAVQWESRIGRRVRLRDLHVLFAVAQHGSMVKAGSHLGMSQSAVSQAISALESAVEVRLVDRTPRGVELTHYGSALMRRAQAAFDELRSGIRDIEHLSDPEIGEVRIACSESVAAGILPSSIERFSARFPKVRILVQQTTPHNLGFASLHERTADVALTLLPRPFEGDLAEHLHAQVLCDDRICLAASRKGPWARRRRITLAELADAALISPGSDTPGGAALAQALHAAGWPHWQATVTTFSVHLRSILSMRGRFIAVVPASVLQLNPDLYVLKELAVAGLTLPTLPVLVVTLKNRTLTPPVERFIECTREVARTRASNWS